MRKMRGITALVIAVMLVLSIVPFGAFADNAVIKSVSSTVKDGMLCFEVITAEGYNRVKVSTADDPTGYIKYTDSSVDMGDGTYKWTIKIADPKAEATYLFDARNATTKKYVKNYYTFKYTPTVAVSSVNSVTYTVEAGVVCYSVVTDAGYNRVKIALASDPGKALAVGTKGVTNADGTITWTVQLADPGSETDYVFDARSIESGYYTKLYFNYTYVPVETVEMFQSVNAEITGGKAVFTIITDDIFNRVKISDPSKPTGYIKYTDEYTDLGNGTYQWVISIDAPTSETKYLIDGRLASTSKYVKEYYEYTIKVEKKTEIKSVDVKIVEDKAVFTVITTDGYNRIKISDPANPTGYIKYTSECTDLGNGTYQWVISITAPTVETKYLIDGRLSSTSKYVKEYYEYTIKIEEKHEIKSVEAQELDGKAVFTVVTTKGYNRVKVAYADNASKYIKYTNDFTELENGDRQWVIAIDMPEETTEYSIDARLVSTSNYAKEYYNYTVVIEEPIVSPFVGINVTNSAFYANVILVATEGCESIVASYTEGGQSKSVSVSAYTINADGNRVFVCSVSVPKANTVFTVNMIDARGRVLDTAQVTYYAGVDHEIVS